MLRNQRDDEIPQLFVLAQLLLAINTNGARYATTKTPLKFWATWQEEGADGLAAAIHQTINAPLTPTEKVKLYDHREQGYWVRNHFEALAAGGVRLSTVQDQALYHFLRPGRVVE